MGWASAGAIFDPVAQTLIDLNADVATKRALLTMLIDKLRDGDWDTWEESLGEFRGDPVIVSAFYTSCEGIELGPYETGRISYDEDDKEWIVECLRCGILGRRDAALDDAESSATAHNELIRLWTDHDRERHGGDGKVPDWVLIGGDA